jgi:hypothetical protein
MGLAFDGYALIRSPRGAGNVPSLWRPRALNRREPPAQPSSADTAGHAACGAVAPQRVERRNLACCRDRYGYRVSGIYQDAGAYGVREADCTVS